MTGALGTHLFLFVAAAVGGALNSVAGGGSFVALPALLYIGVRPVVANTTTTMALWPGSVASLFAYRRDIDQPRGFLLTLCATSLVGGIIGARLLLGTSDAGFLRILPWLMLVATLLFTFGRTVTGRLRAQPHSRAGAGLTVAGLLLQLVIATYGGYFGGGMGFMMLAMMTLLGMTEMHGMNGLKALQGTIINGIALITFTVSNAVAWQYGFVMVAGAVTGGYFGAAGARRVNPETVRRLVVVLGWLMTLYFFLRR